MLLAGVLLGTAGGLLLNVLSMLGVGWEDSEVARRFNTHSFFLFCLVFVFKCKPRRFGLLRCGWNLFKSRI